jgi:hypothetical protein
VTALSNNALKLTKRAGLSEGASRAVVIESRFAA